MLTIQDDRGNTPLHIAVRYRVKPEHKNNYKYVDLLLKIGANPSARNKAGKRPANVRQVIV